MKNLYILTFWHYTYIYRSYIHLHEVFLPGKAEATVENIALTEGEGEYIFSGTSPVSRAAEYSVAYSGSGQAALTIDGGAMNDDEILEFITEKLKERNG